MSVVNKLRSHNDLQHVALDTERPVCPQKKVSRYKHLYRNMGKVAASILLFLLGVWTGLSNLFSTDADAMKSVPMVFEQAIKGAKNVGSFVIDFSIRTNPNEHFDYFDPKADFVRMKISVLNQNDSTFWRLEKKGGRTVVFDGKEQYLWTSNGLMVRGKPESGISEKIAGLLHPETLLEQQREAIEEQKNARVEKTETDLTVQVTTYTTFYDGDLGYLLKQGKSKAYDCVIENIFTKQDGLLREVRMWIEQDGRRTLLLKSEKIDYNVFLDKEQLIRLPQTGNLGWITSQDPKVVDGTRLRILQKETAIEAARRIMNALVTNTPETAKEALYYYKQLLPRITRQLHGCKVSEFSVPKQKEDYAGVFVFYTLTYPDGVSKKLHIALRRDNNQQIWILDGGF